MVPKERILIPEPERYYEAAIMVLIFPIDDVAHTVYIKRNVYNGAHSGQISFPGGKKDKEDSDLQATALRECSEEIGIPTQHIEVLGILSEIKINVSAFKVMPFIGIYHELPTFNPDLTEVQYVSSPSLKEFTPECIKTFQRDFSNSTVNVPYYHVRDEIIWGATAMITSELLEILAT